MAGRALVKGEISDVARYIAERRCHRGVPTVFVNGEPLHFGAVLFRDAPYGPPSDRYAAPSLAATAPPIVMVYGHFEVPDEERIEQTIGWLERVFDAHPDALGACHIGLSPSRDWVRTHGDEMTVYDRPVSWERARVAEPSWASAVWRDDAAAYVRRTVERVHARFDGRVILYQVGAGACCENNPVGNPYTGSHTGSWYCGDFSGPMIEWFRRWLRHRYSSDVQRLRGAWSDERVTFETARPPSREERLGTEWFALRSPHRAQTADFYHALSEAVEACALAWAGAVKAGSGRASLTAAPLGSILDTGLNAATIHQLGHQAFRRALASDDLDMFQAPASYMRRDPGRGDTTPGIPLGTLRMAGKLWLRDMDTRTSLIEFGQPGTSAQTARLWVNPATVAQDVEVLKRDAGFSILKGGAAWWHEINEGMFAHRDHHRIVAELERIGRAAVHVDRTPAPGLAVFVDELSNYRLASSNRLIASMNYEARQRHWAHAGVASEVYHIHDTSRDDLPDHRLLLVTNAFVLADEQADALVELARRRRATLVWLMAPGVWTERGFDLQRVSRITGFPLRAAAVEGLPQIRLHQSDHPWSRPMRSDGSPLRCFGAGPLGEDDCGAQGVGPMMYVDPTGRPDITVLGTLELLNEPGLAVREDDGYTAVYCAAPYLHRALIARIAADSGVHRYILSDDLVHVSEELLLIHTKEPGPRQVSWHKRADHVVELFTGAEVGRHIDSWTFQTDQPYQTRLFLCR